MTDSGIYDAMASRRLLRAEEIPRRRLASSEVFAEAKRLAFEHGLSLICHSDMHYSLSLRNEWRVNFYPTNQRIWSDKSNRNRPYLPMDDEWNVLDVVKAAIVQIGAKAK